METHRQRNITNSKTKCIKHFNRMSPRKFTCRILTRSKSWRNHNTFLLRTNPTEDPQEISWSQNICTCFQIPFYFSLVYMHPQYMIFNLNLMPPSKSSKHSLIWWNANTFQFFIVHEVKGLGPSPFWFKLTWSLPFYKMNLSRIYQVQVPTVVVSIVMSSTHLKPLFISFIYILILSIRRLSICIFVKKW